MDKGNDPVCKGYLYKHYIALILKIKTPAVEPNYFQMRKYLSWSQNNFLLPSHEIFCRILF